MRTIATQIFFFFLLVFYVNPTKAQEFDYTDFPKNTVYAEVGGNGLLYSVNYDRLFQTIWLGRYATRIGYGYSKNFNGNKRHIHVIPVEVSGMYSLRNEKNFFEVGAGISTLNRKSTQTDYRETLLLLSLRVGYRYQKVYGGWSYRIGFTPVYDIYSFNPQKNTKYHTLLLNVGFSVGHTF